MILIQEICLWVCAILGCGALLAGAAWLYWYAFDMFLKATDLNKTFRKFVFEEYKNNRKKYRFWMKKD